MKKRNVVECTNYATVSKMAQESSASCSPCPLHDAVHRAMTQSQN